MRHGWGAPRMGWHVGRFRLVLFVCAALVLGSASQALGSGITNSGDDLRTGWYPNNSSLTPQLVSGGTFGQMWAATVEGQVYAQPLLSNGTLLVATEKNKVYGLDPATGALKWAKPLELGTPWNPADISCADLTPSIGVTSTPVIDTATNIAYMTHKTYVSGTTGPARWFMDAVNVGTGVEEPGFPVELSGSAQNAPGRTFAPTTQLQRPGLLLMNGVVYAAFGSHCDHTPWQGWIFGVSTAGKVDGALHRQRDRRRRGHLAVRCRPHLRRPGNDPLQHRQRRRPLGAHRRQHAARESRRVRRQGQSPARRVTESRRLLRSVRRHLPGQLRRRLRLRRGDRAAERILRHSHLPAPRGRRRKAGLRLPAEPRLAGRHRPGAGWLGQRDPAARAARRSLVAAGSVARRRRLRLHPDVQRRQRRREPRRLQVRAVRNGSSHALVRRQLGRLLRLGQRRADHHVRWHHVRHGARLDRLVVGSDRRRRPAARLRSRPRQRQAGAPVRGADRDGVELQHARRRRRSHLCRAARRQSAGVRLAGYAAARWIGPLLPDDHDRQQHPRHADPDRERKPDADGHRL